ncbi:MAG: lipopolysaccharide transport periplasmic protein LptA [Amylibacter sp.]|nr:lipopolysaccharide transport periplasmic protein LptA [Amylibacter sp.]
MNRFLISFLTLCVIASPAISQSTTVPTEKNATLPVEATADNLQVNNSENSAVFSGNAKVIQGVLDLRADKITVLFEDGAGNIKAVTAVGQVKFTNGLETAEAQNAQFDVVSQVVTFTGNVILRQAQTILTGNRLTYNITTSRSQMSGNVKTIFTPK